MSEPTERELVVGVNGGLRCLDDEALDLRALGKPRITPASHVAPDRDGNRWADMGAAEGPVLGPFGTRQEALQAERGVAGGEEGVTRNEASRVMVWREHPVRGPAGRIDRPSR